MFEPAPEEDGRELKDINVDEVSFVERPASAQEYLFYKQLFPDSLVCPTCGYVEVDKTKETCLACEGDLTLRKWVKEINTMDEIQELFKSLFDEDLTDDEIEKADKLSAEAKSSISGALKMINKYKAEMPPELIAALKVLAKHASDKSPYPKPYNKAEEDPEKDLSKAGRTLSKATRNKLSQVVKLIQEIIEPEDLKKEIEDEDPDDSDLDKLIKTLTEYAKSLEKPLEKKEGKEEDSETEMQKLEKRLEVVEKSGGFKKSLEDEKGKGGEKEKKDESLWGSFDLDKE